MHKNFFRFSLLFLLLLALGLAAWFWRSEALPFQRADPLAAVGQSQPVLVALPELLPDTLLYPWQEDLRRRNRLLDSLGLRTSVSWEHWWLLPARGPAGEGIYTFIGEATLGLAANWQPVRYGPTLPYGGGEIYTFAYTESEEMYFARYRNLLLIGRYPFQLEAALRRLTTRTDNWASLPAFQALAQHSTTVAREGELWLYPSAFPLELPTDWLPAVTQRDWQELEAVRLGFSAGRDSSMQVDWAAVPAAAWGGAPQLPWAMVPPAVRAVFPVPAAERNAVVGLQGPWAVDLTPGISAGDGNPPRLWLASVADSSQWARQCRERELIDYEDYQTYRLEQWRQFSLLEEWTGRRGMLQPWVLTLEDWVVIALDRELLERWLDLHLVGANWAMDPQLASLVQTEEQAIGLLSWSQQDGPLPLLALLFPGAAWAETGIGVATLSKAGDELWSGSGRIQVDWRKPAGVRLLWTAPLPSLVDLALPLRRPGELYAHGLVLGQQGRLAQVFTGEGLVARAALPVGKPLGTVYELSAQERRYLLTTERGVWQWGEELEPLAVPGTVGIAAAAPVQLQTRGQEWEWLLLSQDSQLRFGQADGQPPVSWPVGLAADSSSHTNLWWLRDATKEQVIVGKAGTSWQSYNRQGALEWEAPYPAHPVPGSVDGLDNPDDPRLYVPLVDGKVQVLNRVGQHFLLSAGRGPVDHAVVGQWWGDTRSDLVLQRGKLVHLFAYQGKAFAERWQYRLPVVPDTLMVAGDLGVMAVHSPTQQLWLLDGEGQLRSGFPIAGSRQAFVVGDETGALTLLVVADDELYAYLVL